MKNKLLILTDVNKKIGVGHLMRSIRTAKKFEATHQIFLLVKNKYKINHKNTFHKILNNLNFDKIYNLIIKVKPILCIIDLPKPDLKFEKKLYLKNIKFCVYDRLNRKKIFSNYLINLNPEIKKNDYQNRLINNTKLFLGPNNFPIYSKRYNKKISPNVKNIIIFLGGGKNKFGLIEKIFSTLCKSSLKNCNINFVSMEKIHTIRQKKFLAMYNLNINFIYKAKNIYELIKKADLSIITSGSISFESCYFSVPMILISIAENQVNIAKSWNRLKAGLYVGKSINKNFKKNLLISIDNLNSYKKRLKMSFTQKNIFRNKVDFISHLKENIT